MDPETLLPPDAVKMLLAAEAGAPVARRLTVGALEPGAVGVLECAVAQVAPVRSYRRRAGGEGLLCRVTLADATGEVELVLWDQETRLAGDVFVPGAGLRLLGPTVRPGYRGGVELHLGAARVEPVAVEQEAQSLEGRLEEVGEARVVGEPPTVRFAADAALATEGGRVQVVLWDACLADARSMPPGTRVRLEGARRHPVLEGWFVADDGARMRRL